MPRKIQKYMAEYKHYQWWFCSRQFNEYPFRLGKSEAWITENEALIISTLLHTIEDFL